MLDDARKELVRDSLDLVRGRIVPASLQFDDNLLVLAPELRQLFRTHLAGHSMYFMTTLTTVAELLDDPAELADEIEALARTHRRIGVQARHFAAMGAALLVTLGETLGPDFTCELQEAWRAAYESFAALMIERGGFT